MMNGRDGCSVKAKVGSGAGSQRTLSRDGVVAIANQSYEAREVTVMEGEIVRIEKVESGWARVTNMTDETGWVPLKNLKIVE
jgi:SH3 domain